MFKNNRQAVSMLTTVSAVIIVGLLTVFGGKGRAEQTNRQDRATANPSPSEPSAKQLDDAATPIVDFGKASVVDRIEKNARKLKNARDKYGAVLSHPHPTLGRLLLNRNGAQVFPTCRGIEVTSLSRPL